MTAATLGPITKAESTLARDLFPALGKGELLMADRGFAGLPLWRAASAVGADLLWRVRANIVLPVRRELPDGRTCRRSWLPKTTTGARIR